jgi:adhesin transport system membrane fusion protein
MRTRLPGFGRKGRSPPSGRFFPGDEQFLSGVSQARMAEGTPRANWVLWLMAGFVGLTVFWAATARVDMITRAEAKVVPDGREQVISSLEGGILRDLRVREGMVVEKGQELVQLDPTRVEAAQQEGQAKRVALKAMIARLSAEATGRPLKFPPDMAKEVTLIEGERDAFDARRLSLDEAVAVNRRNMGLLQRELRMSETLASRGLLSDVEVMRLRRQVNDLMLQIQDRTNRFRQDASSELVKVRTELAQIEEQMVVKQDVLQRTSLKSPIHGVIKHIKAATIGGVVQAGAPIMEIAPVGAQLLVEARVKPADIGFVRLGLSALVKLSAYDYYTYGGLQGRIAYLSPDALTEEGKAASGDNSYYRALIRTELSTLKQNGQPLPIIPGMTASVEIRTGEQSVLRYLLKPMLRYNEAFTER